MEDAIRAFDGYLQRFPDGEFVEKAKEKRIEARSGLAQHDLYAAEFYEEREKWRGAAWRYERVAAEFADTPLAPDAIQEPNSSTELFPNGEPVTPFVDDANGPAVGSGGDVGSEMPVPGFEGDVNETTVEIGSGEITVTMEATPRGTMARLFWGVVTGALERGLPGQVEALAAAL